MTQLSTTKIPEGFTEKTVQANGITLNYAIGGTGPTVLLLHGYPQTWYMWRKVMPALAGQYTVIAPDLRGSGGSDAPATGYDKATLAEDIYQLLPATGLVRLLQGLPPPGRQSHLSAQRFQKAAGRPAPNSFSGQYDRLAHRPV